MFLAYEFSCPTPLLWRFRVVCALTLSLLFLGGCSYSDSRLIRHKVVVDGLVGTTMDADVFQSSISRSVGVDFGSVAVAEGSEYGSSQFWPSPMVDYYRNKSGIAECFGNPQISIKELKTGSYHIKARFLVPRAFSDSMNKSEQANAWVKKCDCPKEVGASCFEDFAIREIEKKLTKTIGGKLGGTKQANIPLVDILQMKRRLSTLVQIRHRTITDELGVYQRWLGDDIMPHNIERLDPGKRICFQSYSYNYGKSDRAGDLISALVPGGLSCMNWLGLVPDAKDGASDAFMVGFDPITPLGKGWVLKKGSNEIYFPPIDENTNRGEVDYWAPLDRVTNNSELNFPFALLFTSNYIQTVLIPDNQDLNYFTGSSSGVRRNSILLLFKNAALREFVQQHYSLESIKNSSPPDREELGCINKGTAHKHFHNCVTTLVKRWLKLTGKAENDGERYFHDLVIPSNIRPFTQIPIYLNGELRWVRTGAPLLSIFDEKFRLSEEVMKTRAAETASNQAQPHNEAELVQRALSRFSMKRRRAGRLVEIQFHKVQTLNGLALPLVPGDELSW